MSVSQSHYPVPQDGLGSGTCQSGLLCHLAHHVTHGHTLICVCVCVCLCVCVCVCEREIERERERERERKENGKKFITREIFVILMQLQC